MSVNIKPVLTEKALGLASSGKYTFLVPVAFSKDQIKENVNRIYGVDVVGVNTSKSKAVERRNMRRQKVTESESKKAIVVLKKGQNIDVFAESVDEKKK